MIEVLRNDQGEIVAVCEYIIINDQVEEEQFGNRCFIKYLEINQSLRRRDCIARLVKQMMLKHPKTMTCEWYRMAKYPQRRLSKVTRTQGEKLTREV